MIHQPEYVKKLLKKYLDRTASPAEVAKLMSAWDVYSDEELSDMMAEVLSDYNEEDIDKKEFRLPERNKATRDEKEFPLKKKFQPLNRRLMRVAASVLVIVVISFLAWLATKPGKLVYSCNGVPGDQELPTGRFSCRISLANNCNILIDSTYKGVVSEQDGVKILQPRPGIIEYNVTEKPSVEKRSDSLFNTIETARGQQYKIILSDGTKVRLNAASSLRFPVRFDIGKRTVELRGEGFFEVASDSLAPFYVVTNSTEIKVLGTTFNINAYSENTVTTLLSGRLEIQSRNEKAKLIPGEKAMVWTNSKVKKDTIVVAKGDFGQAVSWKNVNRLYDNTPMREFVLDMGRWYGLEIINLGCVPVNARISVSLCYDTPVSEVLAIIRKVGLRFVREGNTIFLCETKSSPA